jgi:hypothetical protein
LLDKKARVQATFTAGSSRVDGSMVAYYDGDPSKGGKLFDTQSIHELAPLAIESERAFFRPQSCGPHTIVGVAQAEGFPATIGKVEAMVTIDAVSSIQDLIAATEDPKLPRYLRAELLEALKSAERSFREGRDHEGDEMLRDYIRFLDELNERNQVDQALASRLIGQARQIVTCISDSSRHHRGNEG